MTSTDRRLKLLRQTELLQQTLDDPMQCLARTVPGEGSPLEQAHAQAVLGVGDRGRRTRRPAARDDYVGIESSRCHVPRRFRMTTRPSQSWPLAPTLMQRVSGPA